MRSLHSQRKLRSRWLVRLTAQVFLQGFARRAAGQIQPAGDPLGGQQRARTMNATFDTRHRGTVGVGAKAGP